MTQKKKTSASTVESSQSASTVAELINRRHRQIMVHSVLYYRMNESLIDDFTFDKWCNELVKLQLDHPEEAKTAPFSEKFKDFDGSTGFHLCDSPWAISIAYRLLRNAKTRQPEIANEPNQQTPEADLDKEN
jgi:hypothetical protein